MQTSKNKVKATKRLKSLDFSGENSGIALVGPSVGGAANGFKTLLMKSLSEENVKKASEITVTMDIVEYLRRFYCIWEQDAELLAQILGFTTVAQEKFAIEQEEEMKEEQVVGPEMPDWDSELDSKDVQEYVASKIRSIQVMKSLYESKNIEKSLSEISEEDYIQFLSDQQVIEKALTEFAEKADTSAKNVEKQVEGSPSKQVKKNKEKPMTKETEMVDKALLVAVEKAAEDQKVELQKALAKIAEFEEAQKQAVVKSKTEAVKAVIKDEKQVAVVVKAALALDSEEDFNALVEVFKAQNALIEKSALFVEQGVSAEANEDKPGETKLMKALRAKHQDKQ